VVSGQDRILTWSAVPPISCTTYVHVTGNHFDVVTFSVKPSDAIDVTAVYEALAHRRAATRAYVILHVPKINNNSVDSLLGDVCDEAKRLGIGVITLEDPKDYGTWNRSRLSSWPYSI
jgi:hypothetical protein